MLRFVRIFLASILFVKFAYAQQSPALRLPADRISQSLNILKNSSSSLNSIPVPNKAVTKLPGAVMSAVNRSIVKPDLQRTFNRRSSIVSPAQIDTAFVGAVPHDTLVVTGNWTCNGPIYVFNDGVLIFDHANATVLGDIYVWGNGTLIGDSTQFHIPQAWFYQRSVMIVDSASLALNNCAFEFSGMSHNFIFQGEAQVNLNHIYQNDWTTAGLWGNPIVNINDCNLMGEYIIAGTSHFNVSNSDTLLLWQQYADSAVINTTYPVGSLVNSYTVNQFQPGISGVGYDVQLDTCTNVWWGLMPVNGSDVTINNSVIRAIGCWFQNGDSVNASGLVNNSVYSNFTAPLPDRNLHFNNCNVQTWSLYVFDTSYLHITGCILGEVGTQYKSMCLAENFLMDGSGGYFWATDTSFIVSSLSSAMTIVRSERNGIFVFGYGTCNSNPPTAIGSSVMIVAQSSLPQDPIAQEHAVAWYANINGPASSYTNTIVPITGTAFIDQGPLGSWMDFYAYSLYYRAVGDTTWHAIVIDSTIEIRHASLANWNTIGLTQGNYELKLTLISNLGDSVDAQKGIILQPGILGVNSYNKDKTFSIYPNPANDKITIETRNPKNGIYHIVITDNFGRIIKIEEKWSGSTIMINTSSFNDGLYTLTLTIGSDTYSNKFVVLKGN
jgi:hypothetical protein